MRVSLQNTCYRNIFIAYVKFLLSCLQKRKERASALEKLNIPESSKVKWRKVMDNALMSSEESDEDGLAVSSGSSSTSDGAHSHSKILLKRPLPYRSGKVDSFFSKLDELSKDEKKTSALSSRLAIPRRTGSAPTRQ